MKKLLYILALTLICTASFAQQNNRPQGQSQSQNQNQRPKFDPEQYKKNQENFIKDKVSLTNEESQKFFPLLFEMQQKQRENQGAIHQQMWKAQNTQKDEDFENILKEILRLQSENNKIEETYYLKFHKILSWKKIFKVRTALADWNNFILSMFSPQNAAANAQRWMRRPDFQNFNQNFNRMNNGNRNNGPMQFPGFPRPNGQNGQPNNGQQPKTQSK